jgi:hypothetical protein
MPKLRRIRVEIYKQEQAISKAQIKRINNIKEDAKVLEREMLEMLSNSNKFHQFKEAMD